MPVRGKNFGRYIYRLYAAGGSSLGASPFFSHLAEIITPNRNTLNRTAFHPFHP